MAVPKSYFACDCPFRKGLRKHNKKCLHYLWKKQLQALAVR